MSVEPPRFTGISELALEAVDLPAAERFYEVVLGLPLVERWEHRGVSWFLVGERTRLGLWTPQVGLAGGRGGAHVHFALHLPEAGYDAAVERIRRVGLPFEEHQFADYDDSRAAYVNDPDGNVVELWTYDVARQSPRRPADRGAATPVGGKGRITQQDLRLVAVDHVQIAAPAGCEQVARSFYGELLGLKERPKPAQLAERGGLWFQVGDHELHIGVDPAFVPATKAHPALQATPAGIDVLARGLAAAGHEVRWDTGIPGMHRFYVDDPWGNRIEVMT